MAYLVSKNDSDMIDHLVIDSDWCEQSLSPDLVLQGDDLPKVLCVICGMTNMAYKREDGVYVVPITALGP